MAALSLFMTLAGLGGALLPQEAPVPAETEQRVKELVASRIEAPADRIVLEWGLYRGDPILTERPVTLEGSGRGGHWIVRVELAEGAIALIRVRAGQEVARPVALREMQRGAVLTAEDIGRETRLVWGEPARADSEVRPGWIAQRVLHPGDVLMTPAVRAPLAVRSGQPVTLRWTRGSIVVEAPGTSTGSASVGASVAARTESGTRLRGIVVGPGVVNVTDAYGSETSRGIR